MFTDLMKALSEKLGEFFFIYFIPFVSEYYLRLPYPDRLEELCGVPGRRSVDLILGGLYPPRWRL